MKKKLAMLIALVMGGLFGVQASQVKLGNDIVIFDGGEAKTVNGEVVLTFKTSGTFSLPKNAKARILAVGGGGAGGAITEVASRGAAGGGGAGGMIDRNQILDPGDYTVSVGLGGQRVQTIVQSWVGDDGEPSYITFDDEYIVVAKGGGGGGSVKLKGRGTDGGSGGGGSWYGDFLVAGNGTDGQGWAGGYPDNEDIGGGGGGAATTAAEGRGRSDGTGGAGRACDITGANVVYAKGGCGGNRTNDDYEPKDGKTRGYGCGGDGAVNGFGGAGADGVVIVRISELFEYAFVDLPDGILPQTWVNGQTIKVFDLDKSPLKDAVEAVEGETSLTCSLKGGEHVGLGQHSFVLYLKDGYKWNIGEDGSTEPYICYWRVVDPDTFEVATIEAGKTVSWVDGNHATVSLEAFATPEKKEEIPNILFLSGLCSGHQYSTTVIKSAIEAATAVGNLDYYFFNSVTDKNNASPVYSGSLKKGDKFTKSITLKSNNHGPMYGFYKTLYDEVISKSKKYDYIIFSFDRTKVATTFPGKYANEASVANYLKPFYAQNKVIWLVDDDPAQCTTLNITQTPWFPSQLVCICYTGNDGDVWSTLAGYKKAASCNATAAESYRALIGLFCPAKYPSNSNDNVAGYVEAEIGSSPYRVKTGQTNIDRIMASAGTPIKSQCVYNNAKNVADTISSAIVAQPMILQLVDKIAVDIDAAGVNRGLEIEEVRAEWGTNDWSHVCTEDEIIIDPNEGRVEVAVGQVLDPAWLRVDIDVVDNGSFRSSVGARYNERTGLWEKDPNNGPVETTLVPDGGDTIIVETKASTAVKWSFAAHTITGGITAGQGEFVINGFITNEYSVAEGYSPEVVFRGKAGYVLDSLEIDGSKQAFDNTTYNHFFDNIACDHDLRVGFKCVLSLDEEPTVTGKSVVYDGQVHGVDVTPPTFTDGYDFDWVPLYSLTPDGPFSQDIGALDVGTTKVYVRYGILGQLGYADGEPAEYTGWTGSADVTITKRPIEITVCDQVQSGNTQVPTSSFTYVDVNDNLVEGDSKTVTFSLEGGSVPAEGKSKAINGAVVIKNEQGEDVTGNYEITVNKGTYTHVGAQACAAKADDVVKTYDGQSTAIDLKVINPTGKTDGKQTTTNPNTSMTAPANNVNIGTKYNQLYSKKNDYIIYSYESTEQGTLYNCVSNETATLTKEVTTDHYVVEYSTDGGQTWSTELPSYTDAGSYPVKYRVQYYQTVEQTVKHEVTAYGYTKNNTKSSNKATFLFEDENGNRSKSKTFYTTQTVPGVTYTPYEGEATITIKPREVTITADSETLERYNGTTLANNGVTISGDGFVAGQGPNTDNIRMTSESTITEPGTVANVIDQSTVVFGPGYKPENYKITYVDGELKVGKNGLDTSATEPGKKYDGKPSDPVVITIVDADGKPITSGYTIKYAANPWDEFTTTVPVPPTDAGEYSFWYVVDGGKGYGIQTNFTTISISPIEVKVDAKSATKEYDGKALTAGADWDETAFINGEGIDHVVMTAESTITDPGKVKNKVGEIVFKEGTKAQNYRIVTTDGELKVTPKLRFEVKNDGEFSWDMNPGWGEGDVIVVVDGKTNTVFKTADGHYSVHVAEPIDGNQVMPPDMDVVEDHVIEFFFTEDDGEMCPQNVVWVPAANAEELYAAVINIDPPTNNVEEIKKYVDIYNDPYSGWLPVYDEDEEGNPVVVGLRTSTGSENVTNKEDSAWLESNFQLVVTGTGEITFGRIEIPVRNDSGDPALNDANPDRGALTITIDGVDYTIPPLVELDPRCTVTTNDGVIVITDLVLQVAAGGGFTAESEHYVTLTYTRDANDPTTSTAAYVEGVSWKTFGETNDGGTSWIQDKKLWIVDHEDKVEEDLVYLCFRPNLKVEGELVEWVTRSSKNKKIKVKFGATKEAMEACKPVVATLSTKHPILPIRVWVSVPMSEVVKTDAYWKIYIEGDEEGDVQEEGGPVSDGAAAETENTFGVLEVESAQTNTMVAIPWTWYSYEEANTNVDVSPIPVDKLVKPEGLDDGDMIYAYGGKDTYNVWVLEKDGETKKWNPQPIFKVDAKGKQSLNYLAGGDDARAKRGGGLWVVRKNPRNADGSAKKIFLHGQATPGSVKTTILGKENNRPGTTMMGNPTTRAIDINDIAWGTNPAARDYITIPQNEGGAPIKLTIKNGVWGYTTTVLNSIGRMTTARVNGYELKPGVAFWYTRNGEPFEVTWPECK